MITINSNTRQFNIPGTDLVFGVVADSDAERKFFQCPRYVGDNLDLAACFIRINYRNANGKTDFYLVDDVVIDGDNITFSWLLSPKVTEYRGQVKFVMCAVGPDLKLKWHTTQGTGQVMEGLEPDNSHVESQTADVVAQLISMVEEQTSIVEAVGAEQVVSVRSATEIARTAAVNEIEAKRANSLASIPNDYTILSSTVESLVRERAGGIVCSAEGEAITLNDASDQAFRGLRIFGKSTQDGTPTPENPVEIESANLSAVFATGKNLIPYPYAEKSKTINGVTFTDKGDGSVAINGTATANGAYILLKDVSLRVSGDFTLSGLSGGSDTTYYLQPYLNGVAQKPLLDGYKAYSWDGKLTQLVFFYKAGAIFDNFVMAPQIERGTTATAFASPAVNGSLNLSVPVFLNGIPVTSGGNYTDANGQQWICDEVDFNRGVYIHRVGSIMYDGSADELWNYESEMTNTMLLRMEVLDSVHVGVVVATDFLCSRFMAVGIYNVDGEGIQHSGQQFYLRVLKSRLVNGNVSGFRTFLANHPMGISYVLSTPTETPLSETELAAYRALHTNKPNTTILNDSGAYMSVDYTADTKLYIDNKIKEALQ